MFFLYWLFFTLLTFAGAVCWCVGLDVDSRREMHRVTVPAILAVLCSIVIFALAIPLIVYVTLLLGVIYVVTAFARMIIRLLFKR